MWRKCLNASAGLLPAYPICPHTPFALTPTFVDTTHRPFLATVLPHPSCLAAAAAAVTVTLLLPPYCRTPHPSDYDIAHLPSVHPPERSDFTKAFEYVNRVKQFTDRDTVKRVRDDLEKKNYEDFEIVQVCWC